MISSNFLQCIVETITVIIDGKLFAGSVQLATVLNAFLFMNTIFFAFMWCLYAETKIGNEKIQWNRENILKAIPALIIVTCAAVNLFTPVFFCITENNFYQRIGLYPLAYAVTYFYML